jgi:4'-phosphopantetheinyl transferase
MALQHLRESADQPIVADGVEVVVVKLELPDDEVHAAKALLSADELERADRFAFRRDRHRFIATHAKLRQLLGEHLDMAPEALEFSYGPFGKPSLASQPAGHDLRFNVSHSGDVAVFAFTQGRDVGVDVEAVASMDDRDEVAEQCFSDMEQRFYSALSEEDKPQGFFNCWTRKEAVVKAMGDGLNFPLSEFDVTLAPGESAEILSLGSAPGHECGWQMHAFEPLPGFVAAVVVEDLEY